MRPTIEFGEEPHRIAAAAALTEALGGATFPLSKPDAIKKARGFDVAYGDDATVPLADLLEALPDAALHDYATAAKAIDRNWSRVSRTLIEIDAAERRDR